MTQHIGINNNLFGGEMLSWLDIAGAVFAAEKVKSPNVVTAKMDSVEFKNPVKVGNVIYFYGEVERVGRTSITIRLTAHRHDVVTSEEVVVCETRIIYVKVENGVATPI
jgi:acyl-CoA thioesterase YciA